MQRAFFLKMSKMKVKSPKFKALIINIKTNPSSTLAYRLLFFSNHQIGYLNL